MIDNRHETFLALCAIKNYTKTAASLHLTQPAVTQHIKSLEQYYGCKLFSYKNRKIELTSQGEKLRGFITTIAADSKYFKDNIIGNDDSGKRIVFGATLSVGEYVMPEILSRLIETNPHLQIHMDVANTQILLERLNNGELDFLIVEGFFDKSRYHSILFSLEKFIPICAPTSPCAENPVPFSKVLENRLILRENGSGTRDIFESVLHRYNYTLNSFKRIIEIGNMAAIKKLVSNNLGITFLFEVAVRREVAQNELAEINIPEFDVVREFNFVFLKNSFFEKEYIGYYHRMKNALTSSA